AMANQLTRQAAGNPNPLLYALAAKTPSVFHDVTTGSNAVPCATGSPNCVSGRMSGFAAGPGYDLATGWGSVDAFAFVHAWSATPAPTPLSITSVSPLRGGFVGVPYSLTLAATGGSGSYHWQISTGSLPAGLTLNAAGIISGTPSGAGASVFNVQVTDDSGQRAFASMTTMITLPVPTGVSVTANTSHVFPQFADGVLGNSVYKTTLMLSNPNAGTAANCTLQLHGVTLSDFASTYSVPAAAFVIAQTSGKQSFQSGYAALQCSSSVEALLLYSLYGSDGTKISEATVFSSPPTSALNIVTDQRDGAQLGLAIANDSDQSVTYTITPVGLTQTGSLTLAPRTSAAKFVNELVSGIPPNSYGVVKISSTTGKASVIGLRFTGNVFTTVPATASGTPDAVASTYHIFPQFADGRLSDGSYFRTTRIYANPNTSGSVNCVTQLQGMTTDGISAFTGIVSGGSAIVVQTNGTQNFQSGYATLQCSTPVDAQALYSFYSAAGIKLSEATVFSSPASKTVAVLADSRGGSQLGLALANDSDQTNVLTITVTDATGKSIGTATLSLPPRTSTAKFLNEFVSLPANFYGQAIVSSSTGTVSAIGLRFTGTAFTTIPEMIRQ
ncbi:MAG TPA: putative Ig domain-containing protein, partial [Terriglobia bacterium]|nr:putative Ig domain-containing protein [Terriglobia bacterium]